MAFDFSSLFPGITTGFSNLQNNIQHPFANLFGGTSSDPWAGLRQTGTMPATAPAASPLHAAFGVLGAMAPQHHPIQAPAANFGGQQQPGLSAAVAQLMQRRY